VAAEERAETQAAAARMPRQVAEKVAATLDVDDEIHRLAAALAAAIRVRKQAGLDLAELAGGAQLRNLNSGAAGRIRDSIARYFQDPGASPNADGNDMRLASSLRGTEARMTLRDRDRALFDDEAPFFLSREDAAAAAARLALRNTKVLAHELPDGCFTLVRVDDLFVDRASADAAVMMARKVGFELVAIPYRGGWLVRPPRAADAALAAEQAA
jgi:hypothetical protein